MKTRDHYHDAGATTYIVVGGAGCDEMEDIGMYFYSEARIAEPVPFGSGLDVTTNHYYISEAHMGSQQHF
jgi:hypothetical protein